MMMRERLNTFKKGGKHLTFGVVAIALFIFALELMKAGAEGLTPILRGHLSVQHAADALGLGWLMAYVVLSGSPAAAVAMALLSKDVFSPPQAFTMVTGSRLGASFIVILLGFIYALRGHERWTVLSTGVLSLLLTGSIQLLALPVGLFMLHNGWFAHFRWPALSQLSMGLNSLLAPIVGPITGLLPEPALFIAGMGVVTFSFRLFDEALPDLGLERSDLGQTSRLIYHPVVMFFLGLVITLLTLSVSVSIGILVPLSARGYVRQENVIPYILGANISTMIDTLAAAVLLGSSAAVTVIAVYLVSTLIVSLPIVVLFYEPYKRVMSHSLAWITQGKRNFAIFLGGMFVVPLVLIVL